MLYFVLFVFCIVFLLLFVSSFYFCCGSPNEGLMLNLFVLITMYLFLLFSKHTFQPIVAANSIWSEISLSVGSHVLNQKCLNHKLFHPTLRLHRLLLFQNDTFERPFNNKLEKTLKLK